MDFNQINKVPDPHPCCIDISLLDPDQYDSDYIELVNCVQRHVCRTTGYCKSKKKQMQNKCRFGYPFLLREQSEIIFKETNTRVHAEVEIKRNDPYMNPHIRVATHEWRGNTDAQVILDARAAQDYIAKYACKGEVAGQSIQDILKIVSQSITEDDNPVSKLRSIFLRTTCSKRDRGIGEVSRLLLGNPLYHSSFNYLNASLDMNCRELEDINLNIQDNNTEQSNNQNTNSNTNENNGQKQLTKKSLLDLYAFRKNNEKINEDMIQSNIKSYLDFFKNYYISKNKIKKRNQKEMNKLVIIITARKECSACLYNAFMRHM